MKRRNRKTVIKTRKRSTKPKGAVAQLLRPNGDLINIRPANGTDFTLREVHQHIECELVQVIHLSDDEILIIDEEGAHVAEPLENTRATELASGVLTDGDFIVGSAIKCKNSMFL